MRSTHFAWVSTVLAAALCTGGCDRSPNPAAPSPPATAVSERFAADAVKDGPAARPGERSVRLCHVTGTGRYQPILVNDSAEGAHRAHGDLLVGEAVPGLPGMVLDESCAPVARALVITGGSWTANLRRRDPLVLFAIEGPELLASGRWYSTEALSVCNPCVPGDVLTVRAMFDNPLPVTIASQAAGTATIAGTAYPFVEFGGPLTFEGGTVRIPDPPATAPGDVQMVAAATPFAVSGRLKGYEVLGRREPLLVFDVPVTGGGLATVEFLGHGGSQSLELYSIRFDFDPR